MSRRPARKPCCDLRPLAHLALLLALLMAAVACGPPPPPPEPLPGAVRFAAMGDMPYNRDQEARVVRLIDQVNAAAPDWVVHVGDIFSASCSEKIMRSRRRLFERFEPPFVLTPGDNEWADCWVRMGGGYPPLDRLELLRQIFYREPEPPALPLVRQSATPGFEEFVENVRWIAGGVVLATAHTVGSKNAGRSFPGRTEADDRERERREAAARRWIGEAFAEAERLDAAVVVLIWHADLGFELARKNPWRRPFLRLEARLVAGAERFGRPVLLVHGDRHTYTVDRPFIDPESGRRIGNLTRLQVPGEDEVAWVEVAISPHSAEPFAFRMHEVRRDRRWLRDYLTLEP